MKELQLVPWPLSALFNSLSFFFLIVGFTLCKSIRICPLWEKILTCVFSRISF